MSAAFDHDAAREMLALAALDALSPSERRALEAHLRTCAECTRELAEFRDDAASIGASLPQRPMAAERSSLIRARLVARAAADREKVTPIRQPRPEQPSSAAPARPTLVPWLAAAALLIAVGAIAYDFRLRSVIQRLSDARSVLRDSATVLQQRLVEQQAIVAGLTGPGVKVIDAAATSARQPYARMFWDQPTNRWTFVAYNLPAAAPGHTYQLWLITRDQKKVSAGTFAPQPNGSALVRATYPLASDSLAAIAVTNEPAGGSPQPTTTPFLVGAAKTD